MESGRGKKEHIFDADLQLGDGAAAMTSSGVGQVSSADAILDLGAGVCEGDIVINASAVDATTGDESYLIIAQLSDTADFSSDVNSGPMMAIGGAAGIQAITGDADNAMGANQYVIPFSNVLGEDAYRYMRLYLVIAGTTPSITFEAFLSKG